MKIGIDAHYLGGQSGGNETYTRNLLQGLRELDPPCEIVVFTHPDRPMAGADIGFESIPIPARSSYLRVPFALPWLALRHKLDLLHAQYTAPPWCPCPYVVILHDAVMLRFPESLPFMDRHRLRLLTPLTLSNAARVFTVSEAMRREIATAYGLPPIGIEVTPNALGAAFRREPGEAARDRVRTRLGLPERYLLSVGQLQPRKNLVRLAQAFARLDPARFPHKLVVTGKKAWLYEGLLREIERLNLGDRLHFTDYVADEDLPALYAMADAFAFVSLYEGFGIPVIEALAMGTPVLASTDPALIEVCGGGGLHVDPLDVEAIHEGLERVLSDRSLRDGLVARGRPHALEYTPRRCAEAAWRGYQRALGV